MGTLTIHHASTAEVVRRARGTRTLREFADELGGVTYQAVQLWENGGQVADKTLQSWWDDERPWVLALARDVLAAKFTGLREAFLAEANGSNGKQS